VTSTDLQAGVEPDATEKRVIGADADKQKGR
jgi:hypothetical protein